MILKKVKIYNYRQLQKVELDLQNSLTVLAGPNNSGKTTLISVLKGMFRDKKLSFTYSDIPTNLSTSWVEKIIPVFQSIMVENDKNTGISEIIKKISVDDKLLPEYTIECFHAEIQVDYDPTGDDIQLFADYLMDLDESKHSFYFIYSYEPSIASFEKYLGECYDKMSSRFLDIVMAGEIANNKHLINAPAGSGKTTNIRTRLKSICIPSLNCGQKIHFRCRNLRTCFIHIAK